ncbi:MAG: hypothetical protein KAS32_23745 [Candidatus Peribacteraceae bacterium]|nr:hypothetical protein [Candidatus Peribacteraceae bacterium]
MSKFYTNVQRRGNNLLIKEVVNGIRNQKKVKFKPSFFIPSNNGNSEWKSIYDNPLDCVKFSNISEAKDFMEQYKDVDGIEVHGTNDYVCQYIGDEYPGNINIDPNLIRVGVIDIEVWSGSVESDGTIVEGPFPEPSQALYPIPAVTIWDSFSDIYYAFGLGEYIHDPDDPDVGHLSVEYYQFDDELSLVKAVLNFIKSSSFDVFSNWNGEQFDVPYLVNRCKYLWGGNLWYEDALSPWGNIRERTVSTMYGDYQTYDWEGTSMIDYLQLYKSFGTYSEKASYRLDAIATEELDEGKVDYSQEGSLTELYKKNFQKYVAYNIKDVKLIVDLEKKKQLFPLMYTIAYMAKCNYNDVLGTVKMWDYYIYNYLKEKGVAVPPKVGHPTRDRYPGGFVMDSKPGKYGWGMTVDLASLYPHCIQQYNIGPDTHIPYQQLPTNIQQIQDIVKSYKDPDIDKPMGGRINMFADRNVDTSALKRTNITMAPNGECYRTDKMSFLSDIMRKIYTDRKVVKKSMLEDEQLLVRAKDSKDEKEIKRLEASISSKDARQMALKIMINSLYGALANAHFRYFMIENAAAITCGGQVAVKWAARYVRDYLNDLSGRDIIIYSDTDSCFIDLDQLLTKLDILSKPTETIVDAVDRISREKIEPLIDKSYGDLAIYLNTYEQRMFMKREKIFQSLIWVAKKRYAVAVWDNEGVRYTKPKIAVTGLESVRSTTTKFVSGRLKEAYKIALLGDEISLQQHVIKVRDEFMAQSVDDLALPKGVNDITKWLDSVGDILKGCPMHVRASIVHNQMVEKLNLSTKHITNGSKIKYLYLKKPNPTRSHTIAFIDTMPDFKIEKYIDKDLMFDKAFLLPLQSFLDSIGWSTEKKNTLGSFFGA